MVASITFSNKGRTRCSNGHHRKHSSTPLLFSPESKGNIRWPKYKPNAISLPYQTCLLRYKPKLASCHGCHWSFEIMIKWSYESFWSQYYMFFRRKFCSGILRDSFVKSATLKKRNYYHVASKHYLVALQIRPRLNGPNGTILNLRRRSRQ